MSNYQPPPQKSGSTYSYTYPYAYPVAQVPFDGLGLTSMILGCTLLILGWFPLIGLAVAVAGLPFAAVGLQRCLRGERRVKGFAIAGLVLCIVGALCGALYTIAWFAAA